MHRRRLGLAFAILAFALLVAVKPRTNELRLSLSVPSTGEAARAEAAIRIGTMAVSILIDGAR